MQRFVHDAQDNQGLAAECVAFRRALYTATHCPLVLTALKPEEEIGAEVRTLDHFYRVEVGTREAVLEGVRTAIRAGFAVIPPSRDERPITAQFLQSGDH